MNCSCSVSYFSKICIHCSLSEQKILTISFHSSSVHHSPLAPNITIFPPYNHGWILHWDYNTALFSTTLHHSLWHCIILYHSASFSTTLHNSLPHCIILYHTASFSMTLHHYVLQCITKYCITSQITKYTRLQHSLQLPRLGSWQVSDFEKGLQIVWIFGQKKS